MKERTLSKILHKAIKTFPSLVLTGPRQSGKTTLLKKEFGKIYAYFSLENTDIRLRARSDPQGFLQQIKKPVILDEIQYVPELLPYIKTAIDNNRKPGIWLLTGSQNFALMHNVSESLAGRAAILSLQPFSLSERYNYGHSNNQTNSLINKINTIHIKEGFDLAETILRGNYPEIASKPKIDRGLWFGSYITSYLERDIRNLEQVGDLGQYELFLRACAVRTGQILDLSSIAREIGVSFTTAKRWLSLLETGYQVLLLRPYYRNINKRLVKRPKIYFTDTGLVSYLLGINTSESLFAGSYFGFLFETLVITDFWKRFLHHGQLPSMYYLRTQDGLEVDLIIERENKLDLIEIKASSTINSNHIMSLIRAKHDLGNKVNKTLVISNSREKFELQSSITNVPISFLLN